MTPEQQAEQRRNWVQGNCEIENPNVTREVVLEAENRQLRAEVERLQAENRKLSERLAVVRQAANRAIDHIIRSQGDLFSMSGKLRQALKEE